MRWKKLALAGLAAVLCGGARWLAGRQQARGVLSAHDSWLNNVHVLEGFCARHPEATWLEVLDLFRETIEYDDVESHKACQRARGLGCAHGACAHASLGRGCLNRNRTRCCDADLKRCRAM